VLEQTNLPVQSIGEDMLLLASDVMAWPSMPPAARAQLAAFVDRNRE